MLDTNPDSFPTKSTHTHTPTFFRIRKKLWNEKTRTNILGAQTNTSYFGLT